MNMLKKKVTHKKLKPQAVKDADYMAWLHNEHLECFVCHSRQGIQIHHVKEHSTDMRTDDKAIPLCYEHHLGVDMSAHGTPGRFKELYPMKVQLEKAKSLYDRYKLGN